MSVSLFLHLIQTPSDRAMKDVAGDISLPGQARFRFLAYVRVNRDNQRYTNRKGSSVTTWSNWLSVY